MRPSSRLLVIVLLLWAFVVPAAAQAAPAEAAKNPSVAAAEVVCGPIILVTSEASDATAKCVSSVAALWTTAGGVPATTLCAAVLPPVIGVALMPQCVSAVGGVQAQATEAFVAAAKTAGAVVKFIADPTSGLDTLMNATKDSAVSLTQTVLEQMVVSTGVDFEADWFRSVYAPAAGLGLVTLVFMMLLLFGQASRGKIEGEAFGDAVMRLPVALVGMIFTPAVLYLVQGLLMALATGLGKPLADQIGTTFSDTNETWLAINTATLGTLPGGVLAPLVVYGLMFVGAVSSLVGMVMQQFGAYLGTVALGVAWGMWVHPQWQSKARRVLATVLGLLLQKPALLLMLGAAFAIFNHEYSPLTAAGESPISLLVALIGLGMVLLVVGLAPWKLSKWVAALMPGGDEHRQSSGGHLVEGMVGGTVGGMSSVMMQRSMGMNRPATAGGIPASGVGSTAGGSPSAGASGGAGNAAWVQRAQGAGTPATATAGGAGAAKAGAGAASAGGGAASGAGAAAGAAGGPVGMAAMVGVQAAAAVGQAAIQRARRMAEEGSGEPSRGGED